MIRPTFLSTTVLNKEVGFFQLNSVKHNPIIRCFSSANDNLNDQPRKVQISFMTDVEGDAVYFNRFVEQSKILDFDTDGTIHFIHNPDNAPNQRDLQTMFVYGGDSVDKGGSDLYVVQQLISLRERYGPERVHFVLGNRDINKMRITQELGSIIHFEKKDEKTDNIPSHKGVWWLKGRNRIGDPDSTDSSHFVSTKAGDRLKWMLANTMGSPDAFEYRRLELIKEQLSKDDSSTERNEIMISDDDVVRSYIQSCRPEGLMGKYLDYGSLIVKIGKVLFMHGGLPISEDLLQDQEKLQEEDMEKYNHPYWNESTYPLPWLTSTNDKSILTEKSLNSESIHENDTNMWVKKLSMFHQNEIKLWKSSFSTKADKENQSQIWATKGGYMNSQNGTALMQYGMGFTPDRKKNPTVVYESWASNGMPKILSPPISPLFSRPQQYLKLVQDFFMVSDIDLIVTGHQPHGDLPMPMKIPYSLDRSNGTSALSSKCGWLMSCDTSFSGDTQWINTRLSNVGKGEALSGRGDVAVRYELLLLNSLSALCKDISNSIVLLIYLME